MHHKELCHLNSLISSHVRNGEHKEALQQFKQISEEGLLPDKVTFVSILPAVPGLAAPFSAAKRMHTSVLHSSFESDLMVGTSLIYMYGKCGNLEYAWSLFEVMPDKTSVVWNATITACARHKQGKKAVMVFCQMLLEGVLPSRISVIGILNSCTFNSDLSGGKRMHALILISEFKTDVVVETALISMYGKCGNVDDARRVFVQMKQPNVVTWTAMLTVHTQNRQGKSALELFAQMQTSGVAPNKVTYVSLLDSCNSQSSLQDGKHIHVRIVGSEFAFDDTIRNALVNMYGRNGCAGKARKVFNEMQQQDVMSWNSMIATYTSNDQSTEALKLFELMCQKGVTPNKVTCINVVNACAKKGCPFEARIIHFLFVNLAFESDLVLGNALVTLYGKVFCLQDTHRMFVIATERDTVTWNAMIAALVQSEKCSNSLLLFQQMLLEGVMPDGISFVNGLSACASLKLLKEGRKLHVCTLGIGAEASMAVQNSVLNMYCKCDSLLAARQVFDRMPEHDVISWNVMLSVYSINHEGEEALQLFDRMLWEGIIPDKVSFACILEACASTSAQAEVERLHMTILASGCELDTFLGNTLVKLYGICSSFKCTWMLFDKLPKQDLVTWNVIMAVCVQDRKGYQALELFHQMQHQGIMPDAITFISGIDACTIQQTIAVGKQLHARMRGCIFESDVAAGTALIKMYGSCGLSEDAWNLFSGMHNRNLITWNAMLTVCAENGEGKKALHLLKQMQEAVLVPDKITFVNVLSACSHAGLVDDAVQLFCSITIVYGVMLIDDHYNCMVDLLGRAGWLDEAKALIRSMPLEDTFVSTMSLLGACRYHQDVEGAE